MKAVNIWWDVGDEVDAYEKIPTEIELPDGMVDMERISDHLTELTGFCHFGFELEGDGTMKNNGDTTAILHGNFSIRTHKKAFINYLEVVISPEGVVEYAVPSHQLKLMNILIHQRGCTREELERTVPEEFYFDMIGWLTMESGYIAVWNDHFEGKPTPEQSKMLRRLAANGLYHGACSQKQTTWYCVVTTVFDDGKVVANIVDAVERREKPEAVNQSLQDKDIYVEWFDSIYAARKAIQAARKA